LLFARAETQRRIIGNFAKGAKRLLEHLSPRKTRESMSPKSHFIYQNTRFANRSRQFMDAYARGLNRRQAAWAAKKYKGHRVLPENLMRDLDVANVL
jgi:hypothetical protein